MAFKNINRRDALTGVGATAALGVLTASANAGPEERIRHHLREIEQAFREYYPGYKVHATFNGVTLDHMKRGAHACVLVHCGSTGQQARAVKVPS